MGLGTATMARDGGPAGCSRLCRLVGSALRSHAEALDAMGRSEDLCSPYSEEEAAGTPLVLAMEMEKDVLISLTLVYREVKRWTSVDSYCEGDITLEHIIGGDCSWHMGPPIECQSCLVNIVSLLVAFMESRCQHVRHMAGKVLVIISGFLQKYDSKWEEFSRFLWIGLGVAIKSCMPYLPDKYEASTPTECFENGAKFAGLLSSRLKKFNWDLPAALMEALQTIHKSLKNEDGDLAESNLRYALFSLRNVSWDFLHKMSDAQIGAPWSSSGIVDDEQCMLQSNGLFLGALFRLLCSLMEKTNSEAEFSPLDDASVYVNITTLVSDLLVYFFSICCRLNPCICQYLRHKSLALMIRLSFWNNWHGYALVSWVQLLQKYFKDIMLKPITRFSDGCGMSMEGSPFLSNFAHQGMSEIVHTAHLQRQTMFLFVKCCYNSFRCSNQVFQDCPPGCKSHQHRQGCCFNGLSELSTWLQEHVPLENNSDGHIYQTTCSRFSLSFLQLFMDEDDLLFEMLLQLLDTPSPASKGQDNHGGKDSEETRRDVGYISNIFNPIRLLHLFLQLIHYDHSVLLDYLISKDAGIPCVRYLLRCLRLVCESWADFSEFSMCPSEIVQAHPKRRKPSVETRDSREPAASPTGGIDGSGALETSRGGTAKRPYEDATGCLLSLKTSVEGLHQRGLFPYNPTALLRRFTRFQQLCEEEEEEE